MGTYKHVLIATDLSDECDKVVKKAIKLAKDFGAKVSFAHIIEPLPGYGYAYVGVADLEAQLIGEAEEAMAKLSKKHKVPASRCHVKIGPTKIELIDIIENKKVDCIVVGSHGRHGFAELLGSTAHAVVHGAPCDVVTVRIGE